MVELLLVEEAWTQASTVSAVKLLTTGAEVVTALLFPLNDNAD